MMHSQKHSVYRLRQDVPPNMPLAVRSAGSYTMVPGSMIETPVAKWFSEVFWTESGRGTCMIGNRKVRIEGQQIFYLLPGEIHDLKPLEGRWTYHWFTLDHAIAPRLLEAFGFIERPFPAPGCPVEMFRKLAEKLATGTLSAEAEASHYAHAILTCANEQRQMRDRSLLSTWVRQCKQQIDEQYSNPNLNVSNIASQMRIHRTTLFRAFKQVYNITPSAYLHNRRLHHALELLKQSGLPIQEVALRVGIPDANYFARQIKKITGVSPITFRAGFR